MKRIGILVVVVLLAVGRMTGSEHALAVEPTGGISGKVTIEGTGVPIQDVSVRAYNEGTVEFYYGSTNSSGDYTITGMPTGTYTVTFHETVLGYVDEAYNNKPYIINPDPVTVTAPGVTPNIDAALAPGGSISGTVTDSGGQPVAWVDVQVFCTYTGSAISYDWTDSSGNYSAIGVPTDSCKVYFDGQYVDHVSEWYNDKASITTADPVSVTAPNDTSGIDAVLASGGSISGTVTDSGGAGIQGVPITVVHPNGDHAGGLIGTEVSGEYTVGGLAPGTYKVFFAGHKVGWLSEWYNDKADLASADTVTVGVGDTPNIDAVLSPGGKITGTVTASGGGAVKDVVVSTWVPNGYFHVAYTDASGFYSLVGLPTGNHKVQFWASDVGYVNEWYNDKSDLASADPVPVTAPNTTSGINAALAAGGSITGTVATAGGTGIEKVEIYVYDTGKTIRSTTETDATGAYTAGGLPSGNFKVEFYGYNAGYPENPFYDDKPDFASADLVSVTAPSTTSNIDATLGGDYSDPICVFRSGAWLFYDFLTGSEDQGVWTGSSTGCIPAPIDHDGDGEWEFSQLCSGAWHFYKDDGSYHKGIWTGGVAGDLPVPADYDGDGKDEVVIFRGGAWLAFDFSTGLSSWSVWTGAPAHWTGGTPVPVPMDYDGDGTADLTVYSGGPWHFFHDDGSYNKGVWTGGVVGDMPVAADYNGDGTDDIVVFRGGAWLATSFSTGLATWSVWTGSPAHWTGGTSLPAPLDYDGDGSVDPTVYSGGPWHFFNIDGSYNKGIWTGGVAGDRPISRRLLP